MKHADFQIGHRFRCGDRTWLCTDKGQRVVIAVCISPASRRNDWFRGLPEDVQERAWKANEATDGPAEVDPSWLNGPPYALAEHVFDENDFAACQAFMEPSQAV